MTNSLRSARIAELTAAIRELDRAIEAHRGRAPNMDTSETERTAWLARDRALSAERTERQRERTHLQAIQATEAASC